MIQNASLEGLFTVEMNPKLALNLKRQKDSSCLFSGKMAQI